jgi:predicted DNA binding CopG/RHH family protein
MAISGTEKITVRLTEAQIEKLKKLANSQGITATAALQRAIETENYIRDEIEQGSKILVQHKNKEIHQLVFR